MKFDDNPKQYVGYGLEYGEYQENGSLKLHQSGYIAAYVKENKIEVGNREMSPCTDEAMKKAEEDDRIGDQRKFAKSLGAISFVGKTRYDILAHISYISTVQRNPTESHMEIMEKLWMYLAATQEMGLTYAKGKVNEDLGELTAWCDASWHSHKTGHGHTGFFLSFGSKSTPIYGASKKQAMIALNSAEAEIMAVCGCARYIMFFRQLLADLGRASIGPTKIHEDNMSTIIMMGQPHIQSASRHIDRRYLWVKEKVRSGEVELVWTSTNEQRADGLTKIIAGKKFKTERDRLLGNANLEDLNITGEHEFKPLGGGDNTQHIFMVLTANQWHDSRPTKHPPLLSHNYIAA